MLTFAKKVKMIFNRDERLLYTVKEFAHANKNLLIIVADPVTDRVFATYMDNFVNAKIKSTTGKTTHVVRDVVKFSRFKESIDPFISSLAESLNLPVWKGGANQFFQFLDGAIFNIAKSLRDKRNPTKVEAGPKEPVIPSPYI